MAHDEISELMAAWAGALADVDLFAQICTDDCQVWHSTDNVWMTARAAIDAAKARGGLPVFRDQRMTCTERGFLVQANVTVEPIGTIHVLQLVSVRDGKAAMVEEYIGPEMNFAI